MEKQNTPGGEFVDAVCAKVRFKPARKQIAAELRAHLEDRAAMLEEHGVPPEDAAARAAASMGDPEEIGAALNREHSPFWGRASRVTLVLAALPLLLFLASGMYYFFPFLFNDDGNLDTLFFYKNLAHYGAPDQLAGSVQVGKWFEMEHGWVYVDGVDIYAWGDEGIVDLVFDLDELYIRRDPRDSHHIDTSLPLRVYDEMGQYQNGWQEGWRYHGTPSGTGTLYLAFGDPDDPIYTTQVELDLEVIQRVRRESLQNQDLYRQHVGWQNPAYLP